MKHRNGVKALYPDAHWVPQSGHIYRAHQLSQRQWQIADYYDGPLASNMNEALAWKAAYRNLFPINYKRNAKLIGIGLGIAIAFIVWITKGFSGY